MCEGDKCEGRCEREGKPKPESCRKTDVTPLTIARTANDEGPSSDPCGSEEHQGDEESCKAR